MIIENKISHFMDLSIQTAGQQATDILEKYKAGLNESFEQHKAANSATAKETFAVKKTILYRNIKKEFSTQETDLKRELNQKILYYKDKLFDEVQTRLTEFKQTSEYFEFLCDTIQKILTFADGEDIEVYIDKDDAALKERLEAATHTDTAIYEYPFLGGIRAVIPAKNILIDETFATKLSEIKEDYKMDY